MNAKRGEVVVEKVDNPLNSVALRSQRLYLHPIKDTDGPDYSATYFDDDAMAYLGGPWTLEKVSADARANHERWTKQRVASWLVDFTNDDGSVELNVALLGFGALRNNGDIGFGWIVAPSHQRRGISSEASRMALDWFFGTFDDITVITETDPDNRASIGTSESIGFRFRGVVDGNYTCEVSEREWLNLA